MAWATATASPTRTLTTTVLALLLPSDERGAVARGEPGCSRAATVDTGEGRGVSGRAGSAAVHDVPGEHAHPEHQDGGHGHQSGDERHGLSTVTREHARQAQSASLARIGATDATVWPSSRFITRTPVAPRPCEEISRTSMRMVVPLEATATISSSMPTMKAATT